MVIYFETISSVHLRAVSQTRTDGIFNGTVVQIILIGFWCQYREWNKLCAVIWTHAVGSYGVQFVQLVGIFEWFVYN